MVCNIFLEAHGFLYFTKLFFYFCIMLPASATSSGIKVRVYTQVGRSNQGKFALDVAVKALELYIK